MLFNWKEFFKPTKIKIILFIILLIVSFLNLVGGVCTASIPAICFYGIGFPFVVNITLTGYSITNIGIIELIVDIIFWYLISCLMIFAYNKTKKKKLTIGIISIVIIIIGLLSLSATSPQSILENYYNSMIDYSCNVDEDCVIKYAGCNLCYKCMNKNSIEGICLRIWDVSCTELKAPPEYCKCVNNYCVG